MALYRKVVTIYRKASGKFPSKLRAARTSLLKSSWMKILWGLMSPWTMDIISASPFRAPHVAVFVCGGVKYTHSWLGFGYPPSASRGTHSNILGGMFARRAPGALLFY